MKRSGHIVSFNYIKNKEAYKNKISFDKIIWDSRNNFNKSKQFELLQTLRNFYGEKVAFYYTWLLNLNDWLLILAIIGMMTYFMSKILPNSNWYYYIYSFSISVWGMFIFIK